MTGKGWLGLGIGSQYTECIVTRRSRRHGLVSQYTAVYCDRQEGLGQGCVATQGHDTAVLARGTRPRHGRGAMPRHGATRPTVGHDTALGRHDTALACVPGRACVLRLAKAMHLVHLAIFWTQHCF